MILFQFEMMKRKRKYTLYASGPRRGITNKKDRYHQGMYICDVIAMSICQAYYLLANSIVKSDDSNGVGIYMIDCSIPCEKKKWQWPVELYPDGWK